MHNAQYPKADRISRQPNIQSIFCNPKFSAVSKNQWIEKEEETKKHPVIAIRADSAGAEQEVELLGDRVERAPGLVTSSSCGNIMSCERRNKK
jgi:hypothetical protein